MDDKTLWEKLLEGVDDTSQAFTYWDIVSIVALHDLLTTRGDADLDVNKAAGLACVIASRMEALRKVARKEKA